MQVARDLRPDIGIDQSVERADPLAKNRNILLFNLHHLDVRRGARRRSCGALRPHRPNHQDDHKQAKDCDTGDDKVALRKTGHLA